MPEVRLVDAEGQQIGVVKTAEALAMARERDVDLVEVAAQASPPVARLMDYGKYKYEQSKRDRESRKHQQSVQLREVRMKPKIDEHDIDFKTRTAYKLLKHGEKVKVTVMFRAREITHPQIGKNLLDRIKERLDEVATLEKDATLEGRHMSIIMAPDKKKLAALQKKQQESPDSAEAEDDDLPVDDEDLDDEDFDDDEDDMEPGQPDAAEAEAPGNADVGEEEGGEDERPAAGQG